MMYRCSECGQESRQWYGRCTGCGEWNTMVEISAEKVSRNDVKKRTHTKASPIRMVSKKDEPRFDTGIGEFDSVLGGGIVTGSVVLIGGQPGIGKSTLLMQVAGKVSQSRKVLYITAEESEVQVGLRAERLGVESDQLYLLSDFSLQNILDNIDEIQPELVIIDSIQTIRSENVSTIPGTIGQVRECAQALTDHAKSHNRPVIIVAQINKEGNIAGPKHLEHLVDTVMYFDESRDLAYRVLRAMKNRFGAANEVGIFEMTGKGLVPVSEHTMIENMRQLPGLQLVVSMEGVRPLVAEVQALVTETGFSMPQRMAEGFDRNRLLFLLAVLEKKCGFFFRNQDVFLNVPGAVRLTDPACELGVCIALMSSFHDHTVNVKEAVFLGEVGLTGEIRPVPYFEKRMGEISKLNISSVVCSPGCTKKKKMKGIDIVSVETISEVYSKFVK